MAEIVLHVVGFAAVTFLLLASEYAFLEAAAWRSAWRGLFDELAEARRLNAALAERCQRQSELLAARAGRN